MKNKEDSTKIGTIYKHKNGMILKLEKFRGLQNLNTFIELNEDHTEKAYKIVAEMRAVRMVLGFKKLTQIKQVNNGRTEDVEANPPEKKGQD